MDQTEDGTIWLDSTKCILMNRGKAGISFVHITHGEFYALYIIRSRKHDLARSQCSLTDGSLARGCWHGDQRADNASYHSIIHQSELLSS